MQDPSTPNPSDPEQPDSGKTPEKPPRKPLKLKPIGKPEPDPKPEAESDLDKKRKALKLRRMVIKDVEINPHINPESEPVPEAQPFEEPEEAPPPDDLKTVMEAPPAEASTPPPPEMEGPPAESAAAPPPTQPPPESSPGTPPAQEAAPEPSEEVAKPEKKKVSRVRKLIAGLAFVAVFCLVAMLGIAYFNPFGPDLAPIQPSRLPVTPEVNQPVEAQAIQGPALDSGSLAAEDSQQALQRYLERLQSHRLAPSVSPRGIFVDSIFVPEGAVLDPRLGLTLSAVSIGDNGNTITLMPAEGSQISIPVGN